MCGAGTGRVTHLSCPSGSLPPGMEGRGRVFPTFNPSCDTQQAWPLPTTQQHALQVNARLWSFMLYKRHLCPWGRRQLGRGVEGKSSSLANFELEIRYHYGHKPRALTWDMGLSSSPW